jgi:methionyl-tRNA formyltransferase
MLQALIIISPNQFHEGLTNILLTAKANLEIHCVENLAELVLIPIDTYKKSRLISFLNTFIIPPFLLEKFAFGGINFHPGPPTYPGHAPYSFALYEQTKTYGVTAHEMLDRVDSGRIVTVDTFPIPPACDQEMLVGLSINAAVSLFEQLATKLVSSSDFVFSHHTWGARKTTTNSFASMCEIPLNISKDELENKIRSFGWGDGKTLLFCMQEEKKFSYRKNALKSDSNDAVEIHGYLFTPDPCDIDK